VEQLPATGIVTDISGVGTDEVYAIVNPGTTFRFDGIAWSPIRLSPLVTDVFPLPGSLYVTENSLVGGEVYRLLEL
jgi:hypothetical protein